MIRPLMLAAFFVEGIPDFNYIDLRPQIIHMPVRGVRYPAVMGQTGTKTSRSKSAAGIHIIATCDLIFSQTTDCQLPGRFCPQNERICSAFVSYHSGKVFQQEESCGNEVAIKSSGVLHHLLDNLFRIKILDFGDGIYGDS